MYTEADMRNHGTTGILLTLLRIGLGAFFLINSVIKLNAKALWENAQFMTGSDILPEWCSMPLTCIGMMMELVVGVCLLFRLNYRGATIWGTVMTGVFFILYAQAWARGLELSCACTGSAHSIENYPVDTGARLLLVGGMLMLLWDSRRNGAEKKRKSPKFDFSDA